MKIVGIAFQSVQVGKFTPSKNEVELIIKFNDGQDNTISKVVGFENSEGSAEEIITTIRKLEKNLSKEEAPESMVNIVIKDEDNLVFKIAQFIDKVGTKLEEIAHKKDATGYLDLIRDLKNQKLEF